jgi:hypothetical protein
MRRDNDVNYVLGICAAVWALWALITFVLR